MRIRESGMPDEDLWKTFFDIDLIFSKLSITSSIKDAAEFGAGYGTFSIPASKIITGNLYAFDIDENFIELINKRVRQKKIKNIKIIKRDFVTEGTGLAGESVDYVMLFNILHAENPDILLKESFRILKKNGKAGIIHWIYSKDTPRGPSLDIRPTEEQCAEWIIEAGFELNDSKPISLPPYHYGFVAVKNK
ncbi:MAG TPA: methyltransferase domain-containing protein [Ignavibacteriaceae bacterium]|nr:methyltransferase domain-containing protein [Ignavibacteriaceae bacterium]